MERKTMGSFLAALRKANGMTQQEVADKLNVSNKTVSKWERDEGCPEIMMLPAIAELYDVTVDEILRGERISKTDDEKINNAKSEKRAEYLFEKAVTKYTNSSVISVALSAAAALSGFFSEAITRRDLSKTWVCILFVIVSSVAAVIVQLIAFNNVNVNFKACDEGLKSGLSQKAKNKAVWFLTLTMVFSLYALIGAVSVSFSADGILVVPFAFIGCFAVGVLTYLKVSKKLNVKRKTLSAELLKYRKKHIKITAVIICTIFVLCVAYPFIQVASESYEYCFYDGLYWDFENEEEAKTSYYKLKNFVTDGEPLYYINIEFGESYGFTLEEIRYNIEKNNKGYMLEKISDENGITTVTKVFDTHEEMENFRDRYCWETDFDLNELEKNVEFNDETLTVTYKYGEFPITKVYDILPMFALIVAPIASVITGIFSLFVYLKKRQKFI